MNKMSTIANIAALALALTACGKSEATEEPRFQRQRSRARRCRAACDSRFWSPDGA